MRFAIGSIAVDALVLFAPEAISWVQNGVTFTVDWKLALYRLPFSLVLFAPALYLAKESSRHRTNEVLNRRRQHILTTIGPYLALLPQEKADAIKAEVAKSIFSENLSVFDDKTRRRNSRFAVLPAANHADQEQVVIGGECGSGTSLVIHQTMRSNRAKSKKLLGRRVLAPEVGFRTIGGRFGS